ncbi:MAG: DUF47 domain-containing protein [Chloroflexota bacterium]
MPRLNLIPREEKFFDLFEKSARNVVNAAQKLKELVYNWDQIEIRVKEITELEHEGDSLTHQGIERLNRTFVTPLDREDIVSLGHSMDDIVDFIEAAADAILLYKVERPTLRAKELADTIVQSVIEVEKAIPHLRRPSDSKQMLERCVEINRLENVADRIYRAAMGELFENTQDIAAIIKWREIYNHMESATDRCEDVANVLEGVALKNA